MAAMMSTAMHTRCVTRAHAPLGRAARPGASRGHQKPEPRERIAIGVSRGCLSAHAPSRARRRVSKRWDDWNGFHVFVICGRVAQRARRARSCPSIARVPRVTNRLPVFSSVLSVIAQGRSRRPELQDELEARYVPASLGDPHRRVLNMTPPIARAIRARRSARRAPLAAAPSGGVVTLRRFFPSTAFLSRRKEEDRLFSRAHRIRRRVRRRVRRR